ncbi:MAG: hypothetical protein WKF31_08860 [Thermoleophilaceae bacterium]
MIATSEPSSTVGAGRGVLPEHAVLRLVGGDALDAGLEPGIRELLLGRVERGALEARHLDLLGPGGDDEPHPAPPLEVLALAGDGADGEPLVDGRRAALLLLDVEAGLVQLLDGATLREVAHGRHLAHARTAGHAQQDVGSTVDRPTGRGLLAHHHSLGSPGGDAHGSRNEALALEHRRRLGHGLAGHVRYLHGAGPQQKEKDQPDQEESQHGDRPDEPAPTPRLVVGQGLGRDAGRRSEHDAVLAGAQRVARLLECVHELAGVPEALRGVLGQRPHDHSLERGMHVGTHRGQKRRRLVYVLDCDRHRRVALEGKLPGEHLEQDHADRVQVGGRVHRLALGLLG